MSAYLDKYRGNFKSTLRWPDLDRLWEALRQNNQGQWHIYQVGETPPENASTKDELDLFITEIDNLLHDEHKEDYCGIVYADDSKKPSMIKIYDPGNLGVVCGFSDNPPLPGWVLSITPPEDLPLAFPPPGNRKHWWQKPLNSA